MGVTSVTLDKGLFHKQHEVSEWCYEHFGPSSLFSKDARWKMDLIFGRQTYTFKVDSDAALFAVRWGGKVNDV